MEYRSYDDYKKFGDKVGWRKGDEWLYYNELFREKHYTGNLPVGMGSGCAMRTIIRGTPRWICNGGGHPVPFIWEWIPGGGKLSHFSLLKTCKL